MTVLEILAIIMAALFVLFLIALPFLEKSYNRNCEQWKKEQLEKGTPEECVNMELLSHNFIF